MGWFDVNTEKSWHQSGALCAWRLRAAHRAVLCCPHRQGGALLDLNNAQTLLPLTRPRIHLPCPQKGPAQLQGQQGHSSPPRCPWLEGVGDEPSAFTPTFSREPWDRGGLGKQNYPSASRSLPPLLPPARDLGLSLADAGTAAAHRPCRQPRAKFLICHHTST